MERRARREQVKELLLRADFQGLVELAGRETGIPTQLLAFTFAPGEVLHWRAIEGLGYVAGAWPRQVAPLIQRLLWSLNEDSGSVGWGAAAALGEIGRHQLPLVADILSMFIGFLEDEFSRPTMLWGVGRVGEVHPEAVSEAIPWVLACLKDADPEVRGLAAWCLGKMGCREAAEELGALTADQHQITLYDEGELRQTTVGRLAQEALTHLNQGGGGPG